jgi:hypothetical protein
MRSEVHMLVTVKPDTYQEVTPWSLVDKNLLFKVPGCLCDEGT